MIYALHMFLSQFLEQQLATGNEVVELYYYGEDEKRLVRDSKKNGGFAAIDVVMRQFGASKPVRNQFQVLR